MSSAPSPPEAPAAGGPSGLGRYTSLFRVPGARRPVFAALLGRLPIGMGSLSVVLLVRESSSYSAAGLVGLSTILAGAVATPVFGRLIDRLGQPRVLIPTAVVNVGFMAALVAAALLDAGTVALCAAGFGVGATNPPLSAAMRSLWGRLLHRDERLSSAYALEAVFQEAYFVVGPLLVTLFVKLASPAAAVSVATLSALVGTLAYATSRAARDWRPDVGDDEEPLGRAGALSRPGVRTMLGVTIFQAFAFGAVYVAMPAFAEAEGDRADSGLLLAALAAGSLSAGIVYGTRSWRASATRRYLTFSVLFGAGLVPLFLAASRPGMAALMFVAGLSLAPVGASGYLLIRELAPEGAVTEAFSLGSTAQAAGAALGFGAGGFLIDNLSVDAALIAGFVAALVGAAIALARRTTLGVPAAAG